MMTQPTRTLLIVAKEPQLGCVKTRIAATLGAANATRLYRAFSADTFRMIAHIPTARLALAHWPPQASAYFRELLPVGTLVFGQVGADFGARLSNAFSDVAAAGASHTVLIGTDSPSLPHTLITQAFAALDDAAVDVVLGPCFDGGWYLLGLREPHPEIFCDIAWSTAQTCEQTLARIQAAGLRLHLLPPWYDVDTEADLTRLAADLAAQPDAANSATLAALETLLTSKEQA